jgi:hypothetical protein
MIEINGGIGISQEQPRQGRSVVHSHVREQPLGLIPCERLPTPTHLDIRSDRECSVRETLALVVVETFGRRPGARDRCAGEQTVVLKICSQPVNQSGEQFGSKRPSLRE